MGELFLQILIDTSKGIKNYIRAQIILFIITFLVLLLGLKYIGIEYSSLKALGIALLDAIPVFGSGIIMIPWAIYKFFDGSKDIAFKIAILYVGITIFKQFIQPKIVGNNIGLRPLYTFIATVLGSIFIGPLGVILGPILAIIIKSVVNGKKIIEYKERQREIEEKAKFYDIK
ncbi:MAG: AI-2E family transporter [Andreesenia angusta]|nr:AI-2E family transporter [Andreesenia angusta]